MLLVLQKLNRPIADRCNGCRPLDIDLQTTLVECCLHLGKVDYARKVLRPLVQKFRYRPGLHKLLVECERKDGNLDKALFYATKGYFYEQAWNEQGTRAKNLQLWIKAHTELSNGIDYDSDEAVCGVAGS